MSLTNDQLAFELARRSYLWSKDSTLDDTVTSMLWDADPNTVVNGNTPGESKLYAMPIGSFYIQSTGVLWQKSVMPNTWIVSGSGGGGGGSTILSGTNPPGMLSVPPTGNPQLYIQTSMLATLRRTLIWEYHSAAGYWYPTCCIWQAYHLSEGIDITELVIKLINRFVTEGIDISESVVKTLMKYENEGIDITESIVKLRTKTISEGIDISEIVSCSTKASNWVNSRYINRNSIN